MARRTVYVSDLSDQPVGDDERTVLRVLDHAEISSPVDLDASASEVDELVKNAKSFVLIEVRRGDRAPVRYALDASDFDKAAGDRSMADILKQAPTAYEEAPRRRGRPRRSAEGGPPTRRAERDYDIKALRIWADRQGIDLPKRGRIPYNVVEQYKAAGN